jgi:hypothetical protein
MTVRRRRGRRGPALHRRKADEAQSSTRSPDRIAHRRALRTLQFDGSDAVPPRPAFMPCVGRGASVEACAPACRWREGPHCTRQVLGHSGHRHKSDAVEVLFDHAPVLQAVLLAENGTQSEDDDAIDLEFAMRTHRHLLNHGQFDVAAVAQHDGNDLALTDRYRVAEAFSLALNVRSFGWPVDRIENNPSQIRDGPILFKCKKSSHHPAF